MKFGIVVFPGTWSDDDTRYALSRIGQTSRYVWHTEDDLSDVDAVILPGGFAYGDYLRPGAIARFSPVMSAVKVFAKDGKPVLGVCNGFQVLCEAGLLPGALVRNKHLRFRCEWVHLHIENPHTLFTRSASREKGVLHIPISHGEGSYQADCETLRMLEKEQRILFRYSSPQGERSEEWNPNGSAGNIAGIMNARGNVLGMMPHPERACEEVLGGDDGNLIFQSIVDNIGGMRRQTERQDAVG